MPRPGRANGIAAIFILPTMKKLAAMGMMGLTVEEKYGGAGVDIYATMAVIEEIAKRSVAVACPYIMAVCYAGMNLGESASEAQSGTAAESRDGQSALRLWIVRTECRRRSRHRRDDGAARGRRDRHQRRQRWCTGADIADYIFCLLRSGPKEDKDKDLSILLVRPTLPGMTITPLGHRGIRGVETKDVTFDDVRVPAANILGGEEMWNKGWQQLAGRALEVEKLELSACALGLAEAAVADAWAYAEERVQFGRAIAGHQAVRHMLAEARTKVRAMRLMLYSAAWLADQGRPCSVETSMAKLFCCEGAAEVTQTCMRVTGAYGLSDEMDMERYVRDAISLPIVGGSSNMQKNNIANRLKLGA